MRQPFIFAGQRRRRDLRHHKAGVDARIGRKKWRQAFIQRRVYQPLNASLRNSRQRAQRNGHVIQGKGQRLAMKITTGNNVAFAVALYKHQRIIDRRVHLNFKCPSAKCQRIAHCAVDLRNAAQRICVLHSPALAMGFANLAALEHLSQISRRRNLARMRTRAVNSLIKCYVGAPQRIQRHRANHVGRIRQRLSS